MDKPTLSPRLRRGSSPRLPVTLSDLVILDRNQQLVPLVPNPAQAQLFNHLDGRNHLILKARQLGISTAIQAHLFTTSLNQTARVATLAHDHATTAKLRDIANLFYDQLPEHLQLGRRATSVSRMEYDNHSIAYYGTAGNPRGGRGGTYSHIHGSEVAFWTKGREILAGLLQGVPSDGKIILESTPNGARGWFYDQFIGALNGENDWQTHFFPWWYEPSYRLEPVETLTFTREERELIDKHHLRPDQIAWRRTKQRELAELFPQEYPEDPYAAFLVSGDTYFRLSNDMFTSPNDRLHKAGHRYVAGLDFGQSNDYTVCVVIDATERRQVDFYRARRRPWAEMRAAIIRACFKWGVSVLVAEANAMGSTNIEALRAELDSYGSDTAIVPFITTHTHKAGIIADLRLALEEGGLTLFPEPVQRHELEIFATRQSRAGIWQMGAPSGDHDDCVIALALANHAIGTGTLILFST